MFRAPSLPLRRALQAQATMSAEQPNKKDPRVPHQFAAPPPPPPNIPPHWPQAVGWAQDWQCAVCARVFDFNVDVEFGCCNNNFCNRFRCRERNNLES